MEPYRVEPAKTARSKCKACKSKIEKDELRFGSLLDVFGGSGSYVWRCITCITAKVAANVESKLASLEEVAGYPALTPAQRAQFKKAFEKAKGGSAAVKAPKKKAAPAPKKAVGTGRDKPMPSEKEQHAFLDLAKKLDFKGVRKLVESNPRYVNVQPAQRWTALHQAAEQGDTDTVKFLLAHGASIHLKTKDGKAPRDVAKDPAVKKLLEAPAAKRAAPGGAGPAAKRAAPGAKGGLRLYCAVTNPLEALGCDELQSEDAAEVLPLAQAPKEAGAIAKRMAGILGDTSLPGGEQDGPGKAIVIANPGDDKGKAFTESLGMVEITELEEAVVADCLEQFDRDWNDYLDTGFCFSLEDEDDEDEDDEADEERRAKIKAVTKIMAEELTDHFELNFDDSIYTAPKLYGGYKDGSIVGILSYRIWT